MKFTDFLQSFLFRDIISYVAPGLLLIVLVIFNYDLADITIKTHKLFGSVNYFIAVFVLAYICGYINYSIMMKIRNIIGWNGSTGKLNLPDAIILQLQEILKTRFCLDSNDLTLSELSHLSSNMLHIKKPEIFSTMIERLMAFRNFNVSLSGVLFLGSGMVVFKVPLELKWIALAPAVLAVFHLNKSGKIQDIIRADTIRMLFVFLSTDHDKQASQDETKA